MIAYLIRRLLQTFVFLMVTGLFLFTFLVYFVSGGPNNQYVGLLAAGRIPPDVRARVFQPPLS